MTTLHLHRSDAADDQPERRRHPRATGAQPCKILDPQRCRFYAGFTVDLSDGGALIEIPRTIPLKPEDALRVDVVIRPHAGLIKAADMREARVVRLLETAEARTLIAVEFASEASGDIEPRRAA